MIVKVLSSILFYFGQTDDPAQKNTLLVFKFLPLMIGYFALSVPSGLSIYWLVSHTFAQFSYMYESIQYKFI